MSTFMNAEIAEQPEVLAATIEAVLASAPDQLPTRTRRVMLAARGTSAHAAMYARYLFSARFGIDAHLLPPSLATHYAPHQDLTGSLLIGVSQSGSTAEILDAVRWAKRNGAASFGVTNVLGSALLDVADAGFVTPAGVEHAVPATKSHTSQAIALGLLGAHLAGVDVAAELAGISAAASQLIGERAAARRVAALVQSAPGGVIVTGRAYTHGTALEIGLKLEETCLQPVRALSYADLRHGPFAVLDGSRVVIVVAPSDGPLLAGYTALVEDVRATGAKVVVVGGDSKLASLGDEAMSTDLNLSECWSSPLLAIAGQLIALELGTLRGLDVDAPRGLTKIGVTEGALR